MTSGDVLLEAQETIISCLGNIIDNSVFPPHCESKEYSITVENGVILIPTKYKSNGERLFVEVHLTLASM